RLAPGLLLSLLAISYWKEIVTAVRRLSGSFTPSLVGLSRFVSPRPSVEISEAGVPAATSASRTTAAPRVGPPALYFAQPARGAAVRPAGIVLRRAGRGGVALHDDGRDVARLRGRGGGVDRVARGGVEVRAIPLEIHLEVLRRADRRRGRCGFRRRGRRRRRG